MPSFLPYLCAAAIPRQGAALRQPFLPSVNLWYFDDERAISKWATFQEIYLCQCRPIYALGIGQSYYPVILLAHKYYRRWFIIWGFHLVLPIEIFFLQYSCWIWRNFPVFKHPIPCLLCTSPCWNLTAHLLHFSQQCCRGQRREIQIPFGGSLGMTAICVC